MDKRNNNKKLYDHQLESISIFFPKKDTPAFSQMIKAGIASIVLEHKERIEELKRRQNEIMSSFLKKVEEKKMNEIRRELSKSKSNFLQRCSFN